MEKQVIDINGDRYPIVVGHRALIEFERLSGKPFHTAVTLEDSVLLIYCALRQGAKSMRKEFQFTFEEFIDYVDEHPDVMDFAEKKS